MARAIQGLDATRAERIVAELCASALPRTEEEFRAELTLWHPELPAEQYLGSGSVPRCWIFEVAVILTAAFPEYGRALFDAFRARNPEVWEAARERSARQFGQLAPDSIDGRWRKLMCAVWSRVTPSLPPFEKGLIVSFTLPALSRAFAAQMQASDPAKWERQVKALRHVIDVNQVELRQ